MSCSSDYSKNVAKAEDLVQKAAKAGANVILIQELFSNLYFCQVEDYDKFALAEEAENSKLIKHFQEVGQSWRLL